MKKLILIGLIPGLIFGSCSQTDKSETSKDPYILQIEESRLEKDLEFYDPELSPIPEGEEFKKFSGLHYYDIDEKYRVQAFFQLTPDAVSFEMPSTGSKADNYKEYGQALFDLNGQACTLHIYQNQRLIEMDEYRDHLFLLFKDASCGKESYGGGRYIDLKIPANDSIELDFNMAYNPYCSYNSRYSCPIPPPENHLTVEIRAGEKAYYKEEH